MNIEELNACNVVEVEAYRLGMKLVRWGREGKITVSRKVMAEKGSHLSGFG